MRELNMEEVNEVEGGWAVLLVALAALLYAGDAW